MNNSPKFTGTYFGKVGRDISSCQQDLSCALTMADLAFDAIAEPVKDIRGNIIPRSQNIARVDNGNSLGLVGAGYKITQTRDAFKYLNGLPGGVNFQRGGMLKGGRFFLSAEFDTFSVAENDDMTAFGVFLSSFDGSWSNRIVWVLGRHSCTNIARFEIGSAKIAQGSSASGRAAKHTKNHELKLDKFIFELTMAQENLKTEVTRLNSKPITTERFAQVVEKVIDGDSTRSENMRDEITSFFTRSDLGIHGRTLWDAFNAASGYDTHAATRRATAVATSEENAFDSLLSGRGFADKMLPHLMELAVN
jgi:hypothetical protein